MNATVYSGGCLVILPSFDLERVTAFIIPKECRDLDPAALKAYLKERLSPFKVPKEFVKVPDLPRSSTGKILKRELKKEVLDRVR